MRRAITSLSTISVVVLASLVPAGQAAAATGGPDAFGYSFADQASGATYAYIDIVPTGTLLGQGDDTLIAAVNLGASFTFYGNAVTQLRPSTNGFITSTTGTSSDLSNDCPLPFVAGGGGFRIAAFHDDLITSVYYQYLDQAAAAAAGYPGETEGISVFQWVGEYWPMGGGDAVNVEAILFHDDDSILTMVSQATNNSTSATLGIQNATATIGLNYTCNTAAGVTPGATAVWYTLPPPVPPTDSDCCTASPTNAPGCLDATCEAAVCAADALCCDSSWNDACADQAATLCPALCGPTCGNGLADPGEDCDASGESALCDADCSFALCGDATLNATAGEACDDGGESALCDADCTAASCGDGVANATAGEACDDGGESALCDADCTAASCGDGVANATVGEACDDGGESALCDADCTAASCGDGVVNATAGETCDDGGRSDTCNANCTAVSCGDGIVNAAAGEQCDDGDESATCDVDCTNAVCGDGVVNATAGEECDDGNTDAGDGCAPDCTTEPEPGTTGESTGGESTGGESTAGESTAGESTAGESTAGPATTSGAETGTSSGGTGLDDTGSGTGVAGSTGAATLGGTESSGGETDTFPPITGDLDDGCACSTNDRGAGRGAGHGAGWSLLSLFGLAALRRRRRS